MLHCTHNYVTIVREKLLVVIPVVVVVVPAAAIVVVMIAGSLFSLSARVV